MGYLRHHAIVVTASYSAHGQHWIEIAHAKASEIFGREDTLGHLAGIVSEPTPSAVNDVRSLFVAPDGSKEGWDTSDHGDSARVEFVEWLRAQAYEDGSSPLDWVEVQYGDDEGVTKVISHSDEEGST